MARREAVLRRNAIRVTHKLTDVMSTRLRDGRRVQVNPTNKQMSIAGFGFGTCRDTFFFPFPRKPLSEQSVNIMSVNSPLPMIPVRLFGVLTL